VAVFQILETRNLSPWKIATNDLKGDVDLRIETWDFKFLLNIGTSGLGLSARGDGLMYEYEFVSRDISAMLPNTVH
jgi:hypothetical protein